MGEREKMSKGKRQMERESKQEEKTEKVREGVRGGRVGEEDKRRKTRGRGWDRDWF